MRNIFIRCVAVSYFLSVCACISAFSISTKITNKEVKTHNHQYHSSPTELRQTGRGKIDVGYDISNNTKEGKEKLLRRKTQKRKPRGYWQNVNNIENEIREFWHNLNVEISQNEPPTIPNEALLSHFSRHDLRYAIYSHGGREIVADMLGGSEIMDGQWYLAVKTNKELKQFLEDKNNPMNVGLSKDFPPASLQIKQKLQRGELPNLDIIYPLENDIGVNYVEDKKLSTNINDSIDLYHKKRWSHRIGRQRKGYWSKQLVVRELYSYLESYKMQHNRPSVYMPRLKELTENNRDDLKHAIARYYGYKGKITKAAGLIPSNEWNFFEKQFQLFEELRSYLLLHDNEYILQKEKNIYYEPLLPSVEDMKTNNADKLIVLIKNFGGRKLVASRLGLRLRKVEKKKTAVFQDIYWGPFNLDIAIELMVSFKTLKYY